MNKVAHIVSSGIICNLGTSISKVFSNVMNANSGLSLHNDIPLCEPYFAAKLSSQEIKEMAVSKNISLDFSKFEMMSILAIAQAFEEKSNVLPLSNSRTFFIFSTTKGNIDLLEKGENDNINLKLWHTANKIAQYFGNENTPLVVSNACISGVSALIIAKRYLLDKQYDQVVVLGCDIISKFVVSGFQSFFALSPERCRPFDKDRIGLNLGEAAVASILKVENVEELKEGDLYLGDGAIANDANHISAPSREALGLISAIKKCGQYTNVDFIAAHGTATPYNDAMEALAISKLGLDHLPVFSLKGYFGHTLGAAGLLEVVISGELLKRDYIVKNIDFENFGDLPMINISKETAPYPAKSFLKTISGFGGCNAALVVKKK